MSDARSADRVRDELRELSHDLGRPERRLAILGEGNTSARIDGDTFLVKASGSQLASLRPEQLVRVRFDACATLLDGPDLDDTQTKASLADALDDAKETQRPSVETVMHAALLTLPGVNFVGHTHPTAINALTCSDAFELLAERLFPDHVVVCGPSAALVPYVDPGLPLARVIMQTSAAYAAQYGEPPKTLYLRNHGFVALGATALQVLQITQMAVKAAEILAGALAIGTPRFMTEADVQRIHGRDDEHYRQRVLEGRSG